MSNLCYLVRTSHIKEEPVYDPESPYDMVIGYDGTEEDICYILMTQEEVERTQLSFAENAEPLDRDQITVLAQIPLWEASAFLEGMSKTKDAFSRAMQENLEKSKEGVGDERGQE